MELQSPLTQQARPDNFKPKIVELYETLFHDEHIELTEGFWREFFLLKPDLSRLQNVVNGLSADELVHDHQTSSQQLFARANRHILSRAEPSDEIALDTLTVFLECVLNKRYASPSSDIIAVLGGLEGGDAVFTEFAAALDEAILGGRTLDLKQKAVRVAIATVSGAYQTGLVSYFIQRDLFPALMKLLQDPESSGSAIPVLSLLALLVNYNKFEFQNPYKLRLEDLVSKPIIAKIVESIGNTTASSRDQYIAVQDEQPEGWGLGGTLTWLGLGSIGPRPQSKHGAITDEAADVLFTALPPPEAVILLTTYDFVLSNKLFCLEFISSRQDNKQHGSTFANYLSLSSYLFQHAHRSFRTTWYSCLNLLTLQNLISDNDVAKAICSSDNSAAVRLCRQRQPLLPLVRTERVMGTVIIDAVIAGIDHNLKKRLDVELYSLFLSVLLRLLTYLSQSHTRLTYHYPELWRSLLSFLRFLTTYSPDLLPIPALPTLASTLSTLLSHALTHGAQFLPDAPSHDDLFYKILEAHDVLPRFRDAYSLGGEAGIETLVKASRHCKGLLEEYRRGRGGGLSPKEVGKVVRGGYETLDLGAESGVGDGGLVEYRELERRGLLKRIARAAVQDARAVAGGGR